MFQKIVSNLPFSPALIGQLGFYARRLRQEQATRKVGFVFMILALLIQSLTVFSPPESANAASPSDLIRGGIRTKNELMGAYDANTSGYRDIVAYAGITREELESATEGTFNSLDDNRIITSWGRISRFGESEGEKTHTIKLSDGSDISIYSTPLWKLDTLEHTKRHGSNYQAFIGYSQKIGWFAVMKNCANLAFKNEPAPKPIPTEPAPAPAPEKKPIISKHKSALNLTQTTNATEVIAQPGDRIEYTLTIKNDGDAEAVETIEEHLTDVAEYATLIDMGGGTYDENKKVLRWNDVKISPKSSESRKIVVEVLKTIPATPRGQSDPASYDCSMLNGFGNTVKIDVNCPTPKAIEQTVVELPKTGPNDGLLIVGLITAIATYFFVRSRQLNKELRLVRRNFNNGILQG
ncbi:MAG TPA: hypothetical protein VD907_05115 [Verrucomicrobiae bacterium]|nr:hypothetical protein [Verrucomicrobiae bacterium]